MTYWTYAVRSLRFYLKPHLALWLGTAVASTVLVGALVVGDSVRYSLRQMALQRLGAVWFALSSQDRFFTTALATNLQSGWQAPVAPVLRLTGMASKADGTARANQVQVLGVDDIFWRLKNPEGASDTNRLSQTTNPLAASDQRPASTPTVAINRRLADQLGVRPGDEIVLRIPKPSPLSREAPIAPQEDTSSALRATIGQVLAPEQFGDFNLQSSQIPPFNVFISLSRLQRQTELTNRANLLVAGEASTFEQLPSLVAQKWTLSDAQLELRPVASNQVVELRSSRVFLDDPAAQVILASRATASNSTAAPYAVLTYFVNELRIQDRTTPYSMVCAADGPWLPKDLKADEILVNAWLAEDLQAKPGDTIDLKYFVVGERRNLEEKSASFRIRGVLPMEMPSADRDLMPDFPGLSKAENCRDWDAGFAIQMDKIRPKDQAYWDQYRGTPKAFIGLAAGQRLWSSRFGSLTAVRYPAASSEAITGELRKKLNPSDFGLVFQPVRAEALAASSQGQDFGQLFLGFSFFVLGAALILAVLLFQLGVEQRASEMGLLLAIGMRPAQVRRLLAIEALCVALAGSAMGVLTGNLYAQAMLRGLTTIWREAVNTGALHYHGTAQAWVTGGLASLVVSAVTLWIASRRQVKKSVLWLLTADWEMDIPTPQESGAKRHKGPWLALSCVLLAVLALGWGAYDSTQAAIMFFLAGALLLAACLLGLARLLRRPSGESAFTFPSLRSIAIKNLTRRRRRSLSVAAMLAFGSFIVVAVSVHRLDAGRDAQQRNSGTGGFTLMAQSSIPLVHDLNQTASRDFLGLDSGILREVKVAPMRVRDGDDASCLNLNRAQRPRVLGLAPRELAGRHAFKFASTLQREDAAEPWLALSRAEPDGSIPAIGDQASIMWALGKKVGDLMTLEDENGRPYKIKLVGAVANSILQGNLIISETNFIAKYPSENGYRMFLIDAPVARAEPVTQHLTRGLQDYGFEVSSPVKRLALLNAVQNTYLSTFQILGGFGLLIGSVGMGIVVARNVLERRTECALLHALGYRAGRIRQIVLFEHALLFVLGVAIGVLCALVAIIPALTGASVDLPYRDLILILSGVLLSGFLWTWFSTRLALRQDWLAVLRQE